MKEVTRRDFLKQGAQALGGGLVASVFTTVLPRSLPAQGAEADNWTEKWENYEWAFVVDSRKCIGCGHCVVACKKENGVPLEDEVYRTWVERYGVTSDGRVLIDSPHGGQEGFPRFDSGDVNKSFFTPKLCNQCENPPCVRVCPVSATYKTEDGVVLVDRERCIGCRYCIQACPYGARFLHPVKKVADKCTWCYHRITKGLLPACVQACPVGARMFGNLKDPGSPLRALLDKERVNVLKQAMGTEPKVYYLGLDKVVI